MDAFEWAAIDDRGRTYPRSEWLSIRNLPERVTVTMLAGWLASDKEGSLVTVSVPAGASVDTIRRGNTAGEGALALIWRRGDEALYTWLLPDGTVAETDDDPMERPWGWDDFMADVRR